MDEENLNGSGFGSFRIGTVSLAAAAAMDSEELDIF